MSEQIDTNRYNMRQVLSYITVAESYSKVNEYRDILFQAPHDIRMLFNSLRLDTRITLDSIGYASLPYVWSTERAQADYPLRADDIWQQVHRNYQADENAHSMINGDIPARLAQEQSAAVQEVLDRFEENLTRLSHKQYYTLSAFFLPTSPIGEDRATKAVMGFGVNPTETPSPLYLILTNPDNPYGSWTHQTPHGQYIISINPNVFDEPIQAWVNVRPVEMVHHGAIPPLTLETLEQLHTRFPVNEMIALSVNENNSEYRNHSAFEYVVNGIIATLTELSQE